MGLRTQAVRQARACITSLTRNWPVNKNYFHGGLLFVRFLIFASLSSEEAAQTGTGLAGLLSPGTQRIINAGGFDRHVCKQGDPVQLKRFFWFLISILVGAGLGIFYGWVINPIQYVDTAPPSLRSDYKADYVLMVAESYHRQQDLAQAVQQLTFLGDDPPLRLVQQAIIVSQELGYSVEDVQQLATLSEALQATGQSGGQP